MDEKSSRLLRKASELKDKAKFNQIVSAMKKESHVVQLVWHCLESHGTFGSTPKHIGLLALGDSSSGDLGGSGGPGSPPWSGAQTSDRRGTVDPFDETPKGPRHRKTHAYRATPAEEPNAKVGLISHIVFRFCTQIIVGGDKDLGYKIEHRCY
jgi:hypothetical protein